MRLTVFQSGKGDCLLLTSADGKRVLVDGGMSDAYNLHVAAALGRLRADGARLDLVYVSHIDEDHISGVLRLMNDEVAWRVHDFQLANGNPGHRAPPRPRPPEVAAIWHNAFHEQVPKNAGQIEDLLAATASILAAGRTDHDLELAAAQRDLASSIPQGIKLSRRIGAQQLGIPLNEAFDGRLGMVREPPEEIELGSLRVSVIGPFAADLAKLREEWDDWLDENAKKLAKIDARMREDADRLGTNDVSRLRAAIDLQAAELGDRRKVTAPNLASLMLLVEEDGRTLLLTGDGHADDIRAGLAHAGVLDARGAIHVNVLKVQHHGAAFNIDEEFCRLVTADNYVLCGNGEHENPDLRALRAILDSRLGPKSKRSQNPEAGKAFKLWFSTDVDAEAPAAARTHMRAVKRLIEERAERSDGRLRFRFLAGDSMTFKV
jgi:ribonuclease BN (tRNA processing enzyme)